MSSGSWGHSKRGTRRRVSLGGPKPRALLAVLLLHPNEVVPTDRLIDELWARTRPEREPSRSRAWRRAPCSHAPTVRPAF